MARFPPHSGNRAFYINAVQQQSSFQSTINLGITVPIPGNTNMNCTVWTKWVQNDITAPTVQISGALYLDQSAVNNTLAGTGSGVELDWKKLGGLKAVGAGDSHSLIVQFRINPGPSGRSLTIAVDDLECYPSNLVCEE
jgi:hypothetical protein